MENPSRDNRNQHEYFNSRANADEVVNNVDSSVTFVHPWISGGDDQYGDHLEIRRGVPGACRLFGLSDFLRGHVVWSKDIKVGVSVGKDGTLGDVEPGYYIESMTCLTDEDYVPKITFASLEQNPDGSVTVVGPSIHTGMKTYSIVSGFSTGACRLLGYNTAMQYSRQWSNERTVGVSLGYDGQIYDITSGTYLTSLRCKNRPRERYSSPGRARFEERVKARREKDNHR